MKPTQPNKEEAVESSPLGPASAGTPAPAETSSQVSVLTSAIKREIVRSIRKRVADKTRWMPRITPEGEYAYAAKEVRGKRVPVEVTSPEATIFSVLGAALLELRLRSVTHTASGRAEFLDEELLDALKMASGGKTVVQKVAPGQLPSKGKDVPAISHTEVLKALDLLEDRYAQEMPESRDDRGTLDGLSMADLAGKVERGKPVTVEDLYAATSSELAVIKRRLKALERTEGDED
jgi:hypothetical protein